MPTPQGAPAVVEYAGALRLSSLTTVLLRKNVQWLTYVELNVGSGDVFDPESQAPSCGGGGSSWVSELGAMPTELWRKIVFSMIRCPPALVPE